MGTLKTVRRLVAVAAFGCANAFAGPVILGGDDLNDHGSFNGTANLQGWLYIQNALSNLVTQSTRPGNSGRIAVLGATPGNTSCEAVVRPAQIIGRQVDCIDTAAALTTWFAQLASGAVNPIVIVYPGDNASGGVDSAEEAVLTTNAGALAAYVASGGGLLGHMGPYTWLAALLPGISPNNPCDESNAVLTPAGIAAFPLVTNTDIRSGPCHGTFSGNLGGLQVLAIDTAGRPLIIGGGATTTITPGAPQQIPTLSEWGMILMATMLAGLAALRLRRR